MPARALISSKPYGFFSPIREVFDFVCGFLSRTFFFIFYANNDRYVTYASYTDFLNPKPKETIEMIKPEFTGTESEMETAFKDCLSFILDTHFAEPNTVNQRRLIQDDVYEYMKTYSNKYLDENGNSSYRTLVAVSPSSDYSGVNIDVYLERDLDVYSYSGSVSRITGL